MFLHKPVHVIHLTDLHINEIYKPGLNWCDRSRCWDTAQSLSAVLAYIEQREPEIDEYLVTGDIVQSPSIRAYEHSRELLSSLKQAVYCLPGNHDCPKMMDKYLNHANLSTRFKHVTGNWMLLNVNTVVSGHSHGMVRQDEMQRIAGKIEAAADKFVMVNLHHHPLASGSQWLDEIGLVNGDWFLAQLAEYPQVRAVVFGHIHQEISRQYRHIRIMGSPSTCIQFKPRTTSLEYAEDSPAYRRIILQQNGHIDSEVVFIRSDEFRLTA